MRWSALEKFEIGKTIRSPVQEDHRRKSLPLQPWLVTFIGMVCSQAKTWDWIFNLDYLGLELNHFIIRPFGRHVWNFAFGKCQQLQRNLRAFIILSKAQDSQ